MKKILVALLVAAFCTTVGAFAQAAVSSQSQILHVLAANAACGATGGPGDNAIKVIVDASSSYDCDTTGGGTTSAVCICDSGSLRGAIIEDIASYVLITKAGQQSITASGAGNDVSLVAADDVLLTPTDALTVASGGAAAITTTAGAITLTAGGTTEDASVISTDDIFLTPDDALTAVAGGAVTLTSTAGTMALASSAGEITVTSVGAGNDVTVTAADDFVVAAADILAGATTSIALDAAGGTDELGISADAVSVSTGIAFRLVGGTAPPVAGAAPVKGTLYFDTDINKLCLCNGTDYVLVNDDSTTAGCS